MILELWCKGGKGQFSVAGNTIIFVAGQMEDRPCPADKAQADDDLIAALTDAEIETIETAIKSKGRVARDEWIDQAKELMAGKPPRAKADKAKAKE